MRLFIYVFQGGRVNKRNDNIKEQKKWDKIATRLQIIILILFLLILLTRMVTH